jgi:hypothetical protein
VFRTIFVAQFNTKHTMGLFTKRKKNTVKADMLLISKNVNHVKELIKLEVIKIKGDKVYLFRQLWQHSTRKEIENYMRNIQIYMVLINKLDKKAPIYFIDTEIKTQLGSFVDGKMEVFDASLIKS